MTPAEIMKWFPKDKKLSIKDCWEDSDGIWIILNDGWNADNMDSHCRTIHCGGDGASKAATIKELRYQISGISKL